MKGYLMSVAMRAKPVQLHHMMVALCLVIIGLQFADAISTYMAMATGKTQEKNELLLNLASTTTLSIAWVVALAKMLVAALFGVSIYFTEATYAVVTVLFGVSIYYAIIVAQNFHLAWLFS